MLTGIKLPLATAADSATNGCCRGAAVGVHSRRGSRGQRLLPHGPNWYYRPRTDVPAARISMQGTPAFHRNALNEKKTPLRRAAVNSFAPAGLY